jgi:hypothetical protein
MSFFDSKQEVLNIELTQYGKELFSKGLFDPNYYAFFDDDVIYDSKYCGIEENQNDIETRILEESIYNKIVPSFFDKNINLKRDLTELTDEHKNLIPLGTVDSNNNYAPSWSIKILNGTSIASLTASQTINAYKVSEGVYQTKTINIPVLTLNDISIKVTGSVPDFDVIANYLLLEVEELNTNSSKENFEIEIYEITETTDSLGNKQLNRLSFGEKPIYIKDDIMLDQPIIPKIIPEIDKNFSEYYFDINTDKEIKVDVLNQARKLESKIYKGNNVG